MSAGDIPIQLVLRGTIYEDVPSVLAQFQNRVKPEGGLYVRFKEMDNRAVRFLPLLFKKRSFGDL